MVHITAFCRICLTAGVRMHVIAHTPLQEVYEKLTNIALATDMRPVSACYICFSRLRNCHKLMQASLRAEKLLQGILETNQQNSNEIYIGDNTKSLLSICVTPVEYFSTQDVDVKYVPDIEVKSETLLVSQGGYCAESPQPEPLTDDVDKNLSDSEDDIPLKEICLKQEKGRGRKEKREKFEMNKRRSENKMNAKEIILSKEEQIEELLARAKSSNYTDSPYKCDLCYKGFVDAQAYENHKEKHDESSGPHACDICRMRYRTPRQLRMHAVTSHARQYQCNECAHRSHTANQARDHDKWHKGYTYECKLCGQKFRKPTSYLTHMRKSHPTEHVCEICGDSFGGRHGLLMHKSKAHSKAKLVTPKPEEDTGHTYCADCNIQFLTSVAWKRHILSSYKHKLDSQDSSQCRICGVNVHGSLDEHLRSHARSLRASRASESAASRAKLPCQQCGGVYPNKTRLMAHVKRAHLGVKYNKNIVCEVCGKHCTSNATLKYHQRTHTGEKPFNCSSCHKKFSSSNHLAIHTRTHTGEKPYSCVSCGKRFTQKPALNRHMRVHTGVKPYECQYCSKKFSQSNSVNIHVKSVHLKLPVIRKKPDNDKTQEEMKVL